MTPPKSVRRPAARKSPREEFPADVEVDDAPEPEPVDTADDEEQREEDAFLAFLAEQDPDEVEYITVYGAEVEIPRDMPLILERKVRQLDSGTATDKDIVEIVAMLFGDDLFDFWCDRGMTDRQFQLIVTWGLANARRNPGVEAVTFAEAKAIMDRANEPSDPTNRAERRAAARQRGNGTGSSSRRTSSGSTASRRKSSHG